MIGVIPNRSTAGAVSKCVDTLEETDMQFPQVKIAAVHAAPAFLDAEATIDKLASLTAQAAAQDATVVAFGESFVAVIANSR